MILLKSRLEDVKLIGYSLGKIIISIGICMLLPMALSMAAKEHSVVFDFIISFSVCIIFGNILLIVCNNKQDLTWAQGMVIVALAWLFAAVFGALPLFLSGHYRCYLDAVFEAMSGFATTGLTLTQDLDHMSRGHNFWRHFTMFIGGQGIVVFALSFLFSGASGSFRLYVGEARDERVLPNVINTARFIWSVSIVYLLLGSFALALAGVLNGMSFKTSLFEAVCLFMAAFDTGGFAPHSQNLLYYHSFWMEIVTVVIMILGSINFKLHYELWNKNIKELRKNIEMITFTFSIFILFYFLSLYLAKMRVFSHWFIVFRKGFYQLVSAHTGTGFQTIYNNQFINEWGDFALIALIIAMGLGGAICSTTGGIKMLRLGVIAKGLSLHINKLLLPEASVIVQKIHHIKNIIIENDLIYSSLILTFSYLILYLAGALIGAFYGYPFLASLFESTSAAGNVGLSCGITSTYMPAILKVTYIVQMWAGRLEFISIFILIGFMFAFVKGK